MSSGIDSWKKGTFLKEERSVECAICLEDIEDSSEGLFHECEKKTKHLFHEKCLLSWGKNQKYISCPICREGFRVEVLLLQETKEELEEQLLEAAKKGNIIAIKILVEELKIDVNCVNEKNQTPLFFASSNGHVRAVKILLKNGADVNIREAEVVLSSIVSEEMTYGNGPLEEAIEKGYKKIIALLRKHRAVLYF